GGVHSHVSGAGNADARTSHDAAGGNHVGRGHFRANFPRADGGVDGNSESQCRHGGRSGGGPCGDGRGRGGGVSSGGLRGLAERTSGGAGASGGEGSRVEFVVADRFVESSPIRKV